MDFEGTVFRAHNPRWSWAPMSGEGARRFGGRFNPVGTPALYTSLKASTAMLEASPLGRPFQPLTLVSYRIKAKLFDATDPKALSDLGFDGTDLSYTDWEYDMLDGRTPPQHRLAQTLIGQGAHGACVPSFARGAGPDDINVVLWTWGRKGAEVAVIDDESRLPKNPTSWEDPPGAL